MTQGPDPLLAALGALERDDPRDDPGPWVDRLAGRGEAPAPDASAPDEHAALAALFTAPIPEREVDELTACVQAAWAPEAAPAPASAPASAPAPAPAPVVPLRRGPRFWTALAGTFALAAAIVLWVGLDAPPELGRYSVEVRSTSVRDDRAPAAPGVAHRYRTDSTLDLVIAPERAVRQAVTRRVLARDAGGRERLLAPPVAQNAEGVLTLRGRLDAVLPLAPGVWRVDLIVTPEGAAPADAAAAAALPVAERLEIEVLPAD